VRQQHRCCEATTQVQCEATEQVQPETVEVEVEIQNFDY